MITKDKAEYEQQKMRAEVIQELIDGLIEHWFIKKNHDSFTYQFKQENFPYYNITIYSFTVQLDMYIRLGGYSGYEIKDDIITFRR